MGEVLVLSERVTVGRAADCDLQILHEGVSRHHAKISVRDGCVMLTDLSSHNGTFVNKSRIERRVLESGDILQFMDARFVYELVPDEVASSPGYDDKVTSGESLRRTGPMDVADDPHASPPAVAPAEVPGPPSGRPAGRERFTAQPTVRYQPGRSGRWRRSAEPATAAPTVRRPPDPTPPPPAFVPPRAVADQNRSDSEQRARTLASRDTVRDERIAPAPRRPAREAAPVTSGSGAYQRIDARQSMGTQPPARGMRSGSPAGRRGSERGSEAPPRLPAAARGGSATVGEPPPTMARAARETGEYPPPGTMPEMHAEPIAELVDRDDADDNAVSAISALMSRLVAGPEVDGDGQGEAADPDGRLALAAVLQYRAFRQRMQRGPRLSEAELRQHDQLDRYLQRTVPRGDALAAMRRFTRFSCDLPAELTHADAAGMATLAVAVYDVGAGGAKLDVGTTELKIGDEAWLAIDLSGIPEVPVEGASTVVFKSRVVWMEHAQLGVSFAGAPKYDRNAATV